MRSLLTFIDSLSEYAGKLASLFCIALVLMICFDVIARYVFNAPTMWGTDISSMLGLSIAAFGLGYTHRHGGHIRVDVIYARLSPKGRAIVDVACALVLFVPLFTVLTYVAAGRVWLSWSGHEQLTTSLWYPPAAPIRAVFFIGLLILTLQGGAQLVRDYRLLTRKRPND